MYEVVLSHDAARTLKWDGAKWDVSLIYFYIYSNLLLPSFSRPGMQLDQKLVDKTNPEE